MHGGNLFIRPFTLMSACMSFCLCVCLYVYLSVCPSVRPFVIFDSCPMHVCLCVLPSVLMSESLYACLCRCVYRYVRLCVCRHMTVCLSDYLYVCLFVCLKALKLNGWAEHKWTECNKLWLYSRIILQILWGRGLHQLLWHKNSSQPRMTATSNARL